MKTTPKPLSPSSGIPIIPIVLIALAVILVLAARIRLLDTPLERDEGEYAYMGQLMLQGIAPYGTAANMKLPGASAIYAVFMAVLGQSAVAIHVGLLVVNIATSVLIFLLARRFFPPIGAFTAAASYTILSSGWSVMGLWAHATHFVVLPAIAATILLLQWLDSRQTRLLLISGMLFGVSFLMKQHGISFAAFAGAYLLFHLRQAAIRPLFLFALSFSAPFALLCAILWSVGTFEKFWFWTFTYAGAYASAIPLSQGIRIFFDSVRHITLANWAIWLLALAGLVFLVRDRRNAIFPLGFLAFSFVSICPGFYFREHYFILLLPAVALCAAAAVRTTHAAYAWAAAGVLLFSVIAQTNVLFELTPNQLTRFVYGSNPFPEALEVASYIENNSANNSQIVVLGSEPEIYFYAKRRAATPYLYAYPLMESHPFARQMQDEFIRDVEANKPEFVVLVNVATSWLRDQNSHTRLFEWWAEYGARHYAQAGVADIFPDRTLYQWDPSYAPRSDKNLFVLKRKD